MIEVQRRYVGRGVFAVALALAIFLFDLSVPLGVAGGVPYVALVLLGAWFPRRTVFMFAGAASLFVAAGYVLSPAGGIFWVVLTNRLLALFAIWVTAFLLALSERRKDREKLHLERLEAQASSTRKILNENDLSEVLRTLCEEACRVLGAEHSMIEEAKTKDGGAYRVVLLAAYELPAEYLEALQGRTHTGSIREEAIRRRKIEIVYPQEDPRVFSAEAHRKAGHRTMCVVPLYVGGEPFGALVLFHLTKCEYGPDERRLATSFGELASLAIEKSLLIEKEKQRAERLKVVGEIARAVGSTLEPQELFETIAREVRRVVPCERFVISALNKEANIIDAWFFETDVEAPRNRDNSSFVEWVRREVYEGKSLQNLPNLHECEWEWCRPRREAGYQSQIIVPILQDGECIADLSMSSTSLAAFSEYHEALLTDVASHLGPAIRNAQLYESETRSRQFFQSVVDDNADAILVTDKDGNVLLWNSSAEALFGFSAEEMIGKNYRVLLPADELEHSIKRRNSLFEEKETLQIETRRLRKDGREIPVSLTISPVKDSSGETVAVSAIYKDLTEQKRAEEEIRKSEKALSEAQRIAHVGNWDWNIVTGELSWSDEIYRIFRLVPQEFHVTYQAFLNFIHPDDRDLVERAVEEAVKKNKPYRIDHRIVLSSGEERIIHEVGEVTFSGNGSPVRMLGTVQDITEQRRAEEEILKLNEELEGRVEERTAELRAAQTELVKKERLATLGQLTATVSHELRNPLGTMRTASYVIGKKIESGDEQLLAAVARIERNITRCDRIIEDLLDYTRERELVLRPVNVDEWLGRLLDEQEIPPGVSLRRDLASPGVEAPIDPDRLRRAVINIFENAHQAVADPSKPDRTAKGARVSVESNAGGGRFEIIVSDTGPGISPEALAKIFEPLFSTKNFGVGLGLSTAKQIAEQHGGGLEVETEEGKGSRFILWIPLARDREKVLT